MTTLHSPLDARPTAATAGTVAPRTRVVAATVAGNALEFYDFVTYAFFAVYIGRTFFPADTPLASLLMSVAVFGVACLASAFAGDLQQLTVLRFFAPVLLTSASVSSATGPDGVWTGTSRSCCRNASAQRLTSCSCK